MRLQVWLRGRQCLCVLETRFLHLPVRDSGLVAAILLTAAAVVLVEPGSYRPSGREADQITFFSDDASRRPVAGIVAAPGGCCCAPVNELTETQGA
jgi:hypothetical protein